MKINHISFFSADKNNSNKAKQGNDNSLKTLNYSFIPTHESTKTLNSQSAFLMAIPFEGITRQMNKYTYIDGQKDIKEKVVSKHEGRSLIVGQIPEHIQAKFPKERRGECIKDFYNTMSQIANELRNFDEEKAETIDEITHRRYKSTRKLLQDLFIKYNIAKPWDLEDIDFTYLGKGGKGAGYKIEGLRNDNFDEDEYVIKVYHIREGKDWQVYKSHGCYAEINSAATWMNNVGYNTQRGKFFWGDLNSAYMIVKYVDDDIRLPKKNIDPYTKGLKCTDEDAEKRHNVCKGYSYDWGGVRVINRLKNGSKTANYVADRIKNTPEKYKQAEWWQIYQNKKLDKNQKYAGLAMSIKHMPDKEYYIDFCEKLHNTYADRGLAYVLKYLPYNEAVKHFEKLVQTDDALTQVILFNEIPLLAMKHRDDNIKDDLQNVRSEILVSRIQKYYDIAEQYALPESIEHLGSYLHLLPKDSFRTYYKRLVSLDNEALHDRLIYKLSNVDPSQQAFAVKQLAKNVKSERLRKKLLLTGHGYVPQDEFKRIEAQFNLNYEKIREEVLNQH